MRMREVSDGDDRGLHHGIERRQAHGLALGSLGHQMIREVDGVEPELLRHLREVA